MSWSELELGYFISFAGFVNVVIQAGAVGLLVKMFGEIRTIYIGLIISIVGFIGFSVSDKAWMLYLFVFISSIGTIIVPILRSILSNKVSENEQGRLQGELNSVLSLGLIFSPIIMSSTYKLFTTDGNIAYFPGAPYILASIFVLLAIFSFNRYLKLLVNL